MKKLIIFLLALLPFMASAQTDRTFPLDAFNSVSLFNGKLSIGNDGKSLLVNGNPITAAQQALVDSVAKTFTSGVTSGAVYRALASQYELAKKAAGDSSKKERFSVTVNRAYLDTIGGVNVNIQKVAAGVAMINGSGGQATALTPVLSNVTGTSLTATWPSTGALFYNLLQYSSDYGTVIKIYSGTATTRPVTGLSAGSSYNFSVQPVYGSAVTTTAVLTYSTVAYLDLSAVTNGDPYGYPSSDGSTFLNGMRIGNSAQYYHYYNNISINGFNTIEYGSYADVQFQQPLSPGSVYRFTMTGINTVPLSFAPNGTEITPVVTGTTAVYEFTAASAFSNIKVGLPHADGMTFTGFILEKKN